VVTRGFEGGDRVDSDRVPPGQHVVGDFPVLTAGGTEDIAQHEWQLTIRDAITSKTYDWDTLHALGVETKTVDIHCVTHWSKLDTSWSGVPISTLFDDAGVGDFDHVIVSS
jgi:DMSO/TMAO reductase YedYZ molybdopterin-dependent catalytic subunit